MSEEWRTVSVADLRRHLRRSTGRPRWDRPDVAVGLFFFTPDAVGPRTAVLRMSRAAFLRSIAKLDGDTLTRAILRDDGGAMITATVDGCNE